ncbi:ATP-binding cassette domain-containing protein [uncultured Endozoicomonas sp.]|uniref:ATP-binding cassette domain-containing protein n=1 Tax=uncultured Endozoicomonas sp. TaxID=432652 RepID=UPI00261A758F|nr:ATP-binding cassette domain-containing protein [uncultured Endozoicomonas sp.]
MTEGRALNICGNQVCHVLQKLLSMKGVAVSTAAISEAVDGNETVISSENELITFINSVCSGVKSGQKGEVIYEGDLLTTEAPYIVFSDSTGYLVTGVKSNGSWIIEDMDGEVHPELAGVLKEVGVVVHFLDTEDLSIIPPGSISAHDLFKEQVLANRRVLLEAVFTTLTICILGLITAMYTMQVYDRVVPSKGYSTLWVLTVGVAFTIVFEFLLKQARAFMVDHAAKKIDLNLGSTFFARALDIRLDARPATVGTFASQIRHFESVRGFMTSSTLFVLADLPFALIFIFVIFLIAGPVALVPMFTIPLAITVGLLFRKPIEKASSTHMEESNVKNGLMIEAIDGIETLKSVGSEWVASKKFERLNKTIAKSELHLRLLSTKATNLTQLIQQCNYIGLISVGAYLITTGALTMGGLIACSIISGRALSPLAQIPSLIVQWKQAKIALDALTNILNLPTDHVEGVRKIIPGFCHGDIKAQGLGFTYNQETQAINIPELIIPGGQRLAIVGPVGSGKSTLLKVLSGLYKPSAGLVCLDGMDMSFIAPEFLREQVVYLPQDVRLFNGTLRENLLLGVGHTSDERILDASRKTGLDTVISGSSKGLDLTISEGGKGLSGGQRQLVGLTRVLLMTPSVILLDEPTASMDSNTEKKAINAILSGFPPETSIIFVTHKTALLPKVDRIVVIDKGQVVLDGDSQTIMAELYQHNQSQKKQAPGKGS